MDPLAALLSERPPPQLSATELRFRIALLEEAARACRVELESRTTGLTSPAKLATQLERSDLGIGPLAEKTGCFDVTLANTGYLARGGEARWQEGAPGQLRHRRGGGTVHRTDAGGAGGGEEACSGAAADKQAGAAAGAGGGADAAQGRQQDGLLRRTPWQEALGE